MKKTTSGTKSKRFYRKLYVWLLFAIASGALVGHYAPDFASQLQPLYKCFINLIKAFIAPIIFCSIVVGLTHSKNTDNIGYLGLKILIYFEVLSLIALALGLIAGKVVKPGIGLNISQDILSGQTIDKTYTSAASHGGGFVDFIMYHVVPDSMIGSFVNNQLIQVLLIAVLFGLALSKIKDKAAPLIELIGQVNATLFKIIGFIVKLVPIAAFGSVAFTVGEYGAAVFGNLLKLIMLFYATSAVFIFCVLGVMLWFYRINIINFIKYIGPEILLVMSTSSSEVGLPGLIKKLENLGCPQNTSTLVVTSGYSFNMDGSYIYLTLACVFLAQALGIEMTWAQQFTLFSIAMISSKGAAGVSGSGFITLASTLALLPEHFIPVESMALLLAIDQFMSLGRATTNYIGNGVASLFLSLWQKEVTSKIVNLRLVQNNTPQLL